MVSKPKKFFKKNFAKFRGNNSSKSDKNGGGYRGNFLFGEK